MRDAGTCGREDTVHITGERIGFRRIGDCLPATRRLFDINFSSPKNHLRGNDRRFAFFAQTMLPEPLMAQTADRW